jgi:hypothetical protein
MQTRRISTVMRAMLVPSPITAATHAFRLELDLEEAMACREFWKDLYYRLNVVEIRVPRCGSRDEIPELAARFLARFNAQYDRQKEQRRREKLDDPAAADRQAAALGDLRKQRLVADLEDPRGLGAVPAHALEHFQECRALGLSRPAASNLPEAVEDSRTVW